MYSDGSVDRELVDEGQQNLVDYLQKKSDFDVKVNTNFEHQGERISLVYQIDKGKKHKVEGIAFGGNYHLSAGELASGCALRLPAISISFVARTIVHPTRVS